MIQEYWVWLILLLPLGSFLAISLVIRPFFNNFARIAGHITIATIAVGLLLSLWALKSVLTADGPFDWEPHPWLEIGAIHINVGILLDPLTALMLVVVTGVSLAVQVYSTGYMKGDSGYARYFAYMSLFTASMVGIVIASNIVQLYVFWELVGLCSYLLIGFWFTRPAAAAAAKKAFIITRLGDFGFLLAILYLIFNVDYFEAKGLNPLDITDVYKAVMIGGVMTAGVTTWVALGIFAGAVGKSGQFPLHTWLPDAMEGPTPVSALIHAATMVAAGVFLVARFFPLFETSVVAMNTVALIGAFTALFAASMALVMNDIKRVLAYSTISQLGYMMLALGVGAYGPAIFHLFTHALFKALLFMGAGSVNHAAGTFDMRYMGGLRKVMPWTYVTFVIGGLSLAGIFPLAGFWSKDEILAYAHGHPGIVTQVAFYVGIVAALITALYITRSIVLTFEGEFRKGGEADPNVTSGEHTVHLAESPASMIGPLVVLAIGTLLAGFFLNPPVDLGIIPEHWLLHDFLGNEVEQFNYVLAVVSTLLSASMIALAYWIYKYRPDFARRVGDALQPVYQLLLRKYYFDDVYERVVTVQVFYGVIARVLDWFDKAIIDGTVRSVDKLGRNIGRALSLAQSGQVQGYGVFISIGVLALLGVYIFWG